MSDVTLSQLHHEYQRYKTAKVVSKAKARAAFDHLIAFTGDIPAASLGPGTVNKFGAYLTTTVINRHTRQPGLSSATVKSTFGAASSVFGWDLAGRERIAPTLGSGNPPSCLGRHNREVLHWSESIAVLRVSTQRDQSDRSVNYAREDSNLQPPDSKSECRIRRSVIENRNSVT